MAKAANSFFPFGVASGDPKVNSVVIWTAIFDQSHKNEPVTWEMSLDTNFTSLVKSGSLFPTPDQGLTAKITVTELNPGVK
jgi:alkaline phosphatase D